MKALREEIAQGGRGDLGNEWLVACNVEIDSSVCYQATCLILQSDLPHPSDESCVHESGHKCFGPATCGAPG